MESNGCNPIRSGIFFFGCASSATHRHSQKVQFAQLLQELPGHVAARIVEPIQLGLSRILPPMLLGGAQCQRDCPHCVVGLRRVTGNGFGQQMAALTGATPAPPPPTSAPAAAAAQIRLWCHSLVVAAPAARILMMELRELFAQLRVEHVIVL